MKDSRDVFLLLAWLRSLPRARAVVSPFRFRFLVKRKHIERSDDDKEKDKKRTKQEKRSRESLRGNCSSSSAFTNSSSIKAFLPLSSPQGASPLFFSPKTCLIATLEPLARGSGGEKGR